MCKRVRLLANCSLEKCTKVLYTGGRSCKTPAINYDFDGHIEMVFEASSVGALGAYLRLWIHWVV
jgi:hypothetical protein